MYITIDQLKAFIQENLLTQGLDDAGENLVDQSLFAVIEEAVERDVHGYLEGRYEVPIRLNVPNLVVHACLVFFAEALWTRRGSSADANPFYVAAKAVRTRLDDVRTGKQQLSLQQEPEQDAGFVITESSRVSGSERLSL